MVVTMNPFDAGGYAPLRGRTTAVVFLLVRQVRLRKRLDLDAPARAAEAALPGRIVAQWRS